MMQRKGVGYSRGDEGAGRHWIPRPVSCSASARAQQGQQVEGQDREQPGSPAP